MSDAHDKQAENALEYLRIVSDIELGPKFTEDTKSRPLSRDEQNVKEAALTSLLDYFVSDPDRKPAKTIVPNKGKSKIKKKKKEKQ